MDRRDCAPADEGLIALVERYGIAREWIEREFSRSLADFIWGDHRE